MANNQVVENLGVLLGALRKYNEPQREAKKVLEKMAFEKSMVDLRFDNEQTLAAEAAASTLSNQKALLKWQATDPDQKKMREDKLADERAYETKKLKFEAENLLTVAKIEQQGSIYKAKLTKVETDTLTGMAADESLDASVRAETTRILDLNVEGKLTLKHLTEYKGTTGEQLFSPWNKDNRKNMLYQAGAGFTAAGISTASYKGSKAAYTAGRPVVGTALAATSLVSGVVALNQALEVTGGTVNALTGELETATGIDLTIGDRRRNIIDTYNTNQSNILSQLSQAAVNIAPAVAAGREGAIAEQKRITAQIKQIQGTDDAYYIKKHGTKEQIARYKIQAEAILNFSDIYNVDVPLSSETLSKPIPVRKEMDYKISTALDAITETTK